MLWYAYISSAGQPSAILVRLDTVALSAAFPLLTSSESSAACDLGVTLDSEIPFNTHIYYKLPIVVTESINCASSSLSPVHFLHPQPLPLYIGLPLLQLDLTTVAQSTLSSLLADRDAWIGSCVLLPA